MHSTVDAVPENPVRIEQGQLESMFIDSLFSFST